ncbi:MAG: 50S ribosomal protein L6 [Deltaproteobacteria bacterium]|nr:50S ribosomal protein L6 [Deltaproteobacteria bacterium]MBW1914512.1 50S ribosomal protein L6 [Deltaproteobacteria bacterium]
MSRIGKMPIPIPKDVSVDLKGSLITVKGPKGELKQVIHPKVTVITEDNQVLVSVGDDTKESKSLHGLFRSLIANLVTGVTSGFEKALDIVGVGYRAELSGNTATFHLGYSHPIIFELPDGIKAKIDKTRITVNGIDKELVGRTAAKIRGFRKPEPYKGKGIRYINETVKRKAGKTAAT